MKTKALFGFMLAAVLALFAVSSVLAGTLSISTPSVELNDVELGDSITAAGLAGETVPVKVQFTANADIEDVKVRTWIEGYKSDVSASTARFDVVNGSTYVKKLTLTLPTQEDLDGTEESLTLYVRIADKDDELEVDYKIVMQRDTYSVQLLSVEAPSVASAGEIVALDIVLKNTGLREAEDTFVTVSIPELGVSKKAYFGDLTPEDQANPDKEDARERRVYLIVPANTKTGEYELSVKASNYDTTATVKKVIAITGLATENTNSTTVTPGVSNKKAEGMPTSIIVLTVVLVIIFVVLLVVLIVLLTKKPSDKVEDFGETSYY